MYTYGFEKLLVWQVSSQLVRHIYQVTATFPKNEQFGLTNQLRRASVSISSNIAEGSGRISNKDKARCIEIAYSSLLEVVNHLILSNDLDFIGDSLLSALREEVSDLSDKLNAFHKKLLPNAQITKYTNKH